MVARRGDLTRAIELTREIDKISKTSPWERFCEPESTRPRGSRATWPNLTRKPSNATPPTRTASAPRANQLKLGDADLALRQANMVLDVEKNRTDALLLQARAMAETGTTPPKKTKCNARQSPGSKRSPRPIHALKRRFTRWPRFTSSAPDRRRRRRLEGRLEGQSR